MVEIKKDRLSDLLNELFGITEHVNYPEIPDGWICKQPLQVELAISEFRHRNNINNLFPRIRGN